jgi:hypothetical protein
MPRAPVGRIERPLSDPITAAGKMASQRPPIGVGADSPPACAQPRCPTDALPAHGSPEPTPLSSAHARRGHFSGSRSGSLEPVDGRPRRSQTAPPRREVGGLRLPAHSSVRRVRRATLGIHAVGAVGRIERPLSDAITAARKMASQRPPIGVGADSPPACAQPRCPTDALPAPGLPEPTPTSSALMRRGIFPRREAGASSRSTAPARSKTYCRAKREA